MPWQILGLDPASATTAEVKQAYARLLKTCRPDRDPEGFRKLHAAYEEALDLLSRESKWRQVPPQTELAEETPVSRKDLSNGDSREWADADRSQDMEILVNQMLHGNFELPLLAICRAEDSGNRGFLAVMTKLVLASPKLTAGSDGLGMAAHLACAGMTWSIEGSLPLSESVYRQLTSRTREVFSRNLEDCERLGALLATIPSEWQIFWKQKIQQKNQVWTDQKSLEALRVLNSEEGRTWRCFRLLRGMLPPDMAADVPPPLPFVLQPVIAAAPRPLARKSFLLKAIIGSLALAMLVLLGSLVMLIFGSSWKSNVEGYKVIGPKKPPSPGQ